MSQTTPTAATRYGSLSALITRQTGHVEPRELEALLGLLTAAVSAAAEVKRGGTTERLVGALAAVVLALVPQSKPATSRKELAALLNATRITNAELRAQLAKANRRALTTPLPKVLRGGAVTAGVQSRAISPDAGPEKCATPTGKAT